MEIEAWFLAEYTHFQRIPRRHSKASPAGKAAPVRALTPKAAVRVAYEAMDWRPGDGAI
jgi:hypothetical protein